MNLEGTKHEKAVIVVITYIIGFTSGFIAFGITGAMKPSVTEVVMPVTVMPEDYVGPTENPPADMEAAVINSGDTVASYEDGKLYATVRGERFVLSLHTDVMNTDNVEGFSTQGIHESLPAYSASQDGRFVYFCEQQTVDDSCSHFLFDANRNVIHPISVAGERLVTTSSIAEQAVWNGDLLTIGSHFSVSPDTPWKMASAE